MSRTVDRALKHTHMHTRSSRTQTTFQPLLDTVRRGLRRIGMNVREDIELKVHLAFDPEASVWYIAESDIPGLRLEADDPMDLVRRISESAGELLNLNQSEVLERHQSKARRAIRFTPIFDSSLPVAAYA